MKIEKLANGRVLLLENNNEVIRGISSAVTLKEHPYLVDVVLICDDLIDDEHYCINIDSTDLSLINVGNETVFVGDTHDLIRELYDTYLGTVSISPGEAGHIITGESILDFVVVNSTELIYTGSQLTQKVLTLDDETTIIINFTYTGSKLTQKVYIGAGIPSGASKLTTTYSYTGDNLTEITHT